MYLEKSCLTVTVLINLLMAPGLSAEDKLYRWVDQQGKTYYSDKVPPEHKDYKRQQLNQNAQTIAITAAPQTADQRAEEQQINQLRAQAEKIIRTRELEDKLLLKSFRSQKELDIALDNKLKMADFQIKVAMNNKERLEQQLTKQMHDAARYEKNGQKVPENHLKRIEATKSQLQNCLELIEESENQKLALKDDFQEKQTRFLELQRQGAISQKPLPADQTLNHTPVLSILDCSQMDCDKAWPVARNFVIEHATSGMHIDMKNLLTSKNPARLQQLSLNLVRIPQDSVADVIFLDASCHHSSLGKELCESVEVKKLLKDFPETVRSALASQKLRADASISK